MSILLERVDGGFEKRHEFESVSHGWQIPFMEERKEAAVVVNVVGSFPTELEPRRI